MARGRSETAGILRISRRRLDYEVGRLVTDLLVHAEAAPALSLAEVSSLLGVSYDSARRMAKRGELESDAERGGNRTYTVQAVVAARDALERRRTRERREALVRRQRGRRTRLEAVLSSGRPAEVAR